MPHFAAYLGVLFAMGSQLHGIEQSSSSVFASPYLIAQLDPKAPRFARFQVDGLGKGSIGEDAVLSSVPPAQSDLRFRQDGVTASYVVAESGAQDTAAWTVRFEDRAVVLESRYLPNRYVPAFELDFRQKLCHATLLGIMAPESLSPQPLSPPGQEKGAPSVGGMKWGVKLPCVLHLPDSGSVRISGDGGFALGYDARRYVRPEPYVKIAFPAATKDHPKVIYRLDVQAVHPKLSGLTEDSIFDGFKRGFLNIFQLNPRLGMLANNASSDIVPFTMYMYAEVAKKAPPLTKGLSCMDLVRATLDKYLAGVKGYGQVGYGPGKTEADVVGWGSPYDSLDTYPSLLIAAGEYTLAKNDKRWAKENWAGLSAWADKMMAGDRDGNGLIEFPRTGNLGDRPTPESRPANWWDCINFGHEDAYSNALAYRAAELMGDVAKRIGKAKEAERLSAFSTKLKAAYLTTFLNPKTGLLAGWRSKDGSLHDYAFTFVQGIAVTYGLIEEKAANSIMDTLMAKMKAVKFNRFDLGLPGNLVAVPKADYCQHNWAGAIGVGEPSLDDGSDAFQIYENGGATGCYAYFTVKALYKLGRVDDARRIFLPMLKGYAEGNFMGFGPNGQSKDWRAWDGTCHGYEGLLVDSFMPLLCVEDELRARTKDRR